MLVPAGVLAQQTTGAQYLTQEWIIYKDGTNIFRYRSVDVEAGTISADIATFNLTGLSGCLDTDGQFVFITSSNWDGSGYSKYQYSFNGTNFVQQLAASIDTDSGRGIHFLPANPGYLVSGGGGQGLKAFSYQTAPTYAWGTPVARTETADNWQSILDVRVANAGEIGKGDTMVTLPNTSSNQYVNSYTLSGTTFTKYGGDNSCSTYAYGQASGVDRNTGDIAMVGASLQTVYLMKMDTSTRVITAQGVSSSIGANIGTCCWVNGFLIIGKATGGVVESYTRSGTTLTTTGYSISYGGSFSVNISMDVSPYTNHIYVAINGNLQVIEVGPNGELTTAATSSSFPINSGSDRWRVAFLPAALTVT